jgi:hypothetical protein
MATTEAKIRNSLSGKDFTNLKVGEQITYSGWDNLYIMFDELLEVLVLIIDSPKVKQVPIIPHTSMTYHDVQ